MSRSGQPPSKRLRSPAAAITELTALVRPVLIDGTLRVRLADAPSKWRAVLDDLWWAFADLLPRGSTELHPQDWDEVLDRLRVVQDRALKIGDRLWLADQGPPPDELAIAPTLSPWLLACLPGETPSLAGGVTGHPILGDRRWIRTSMLLRINEQAGWARTLTRWYRLGTRMTIEQATAVHGYELDPCADAVHGWLDVDHERLDRLPAGPRPGPPRWRPTAGDPGVAVKLTLEGLPPDRLHELVAAVREVARDPLPVEGDDRFVTLDAWTVHTDDRGLPFLLGRGGFPGLGVSAFVDIAVLVRVEARLLRTANWWTRLGKLHPNDDPEAAKRILADTAERCDALRAAVLE